MADLNVTVSKDILDIQKAQTETVIQTDSVADDLVRKTQPLKALIAGVGIITICTAQQLPSMLTARRRSLTM